MEKSDRKTKAPNRPVAEIVLERLRAMSPDALNDIGRQLASESPMAAQILARALTNANTSGPV